MTTKACIRRIASLLLVCMVFFATGSALAVPLAFTAEDGRTEGLTVDKLSTRSGPATAYRETGTYKVMGEWIRILSYAYDNNAVCWLQCDIPYGNKLRRLYTGLKRFDAATVDLRALPEEDPPSLEKVLVLATSRALYGPGDGYDVYDKLTVDKRQKVTLIATEGDYAQVEWTTTKQSYRAWVPLDTLDY